MEWCPFGAASAAGAGQDRDEPLGEGKLLRGHGVPAADAGVGSRRRAGRSFSGQPAGASADYRARPAAARASAAREVPVDLAGDVALEDADDLGLGTALGEAALDVGAGAGVASSCG